MQTGLVPSVACQTGTLHHDVRRAGGEPRSVLFGAATSSPFEPEQKRPRTFDSGVG